jgi:hypothetical protein
MQDIIAFLQYDVDRTPFSSLWMTGTGVASLMYFSFQIQQGVVKA